MTYTISTVYVKINEQIEYLFYEYLYAGVPGVEVAALSWKRLFQEHCGKVREW